MFMGEQPVQTRMVSNPGMMGENYITVYILYTGCICSRENHKPQLG